MKGDSLYILVSTKSSLNVISLHKLCPFLIVLVCLVFEQEYIDYIIQRPVCVSLYRSDKFGLVCLVFEQEYIDYIIQRPVCVSVYRSDKFGIGNGKKSSCVRSRKDAIYFNNFCGTVQSRMPQNLC